MDGQKTYIVCGNFRGGTTAVAQLLDRLGIPMGEKMDPNRNCENLEFQQLSLRDTLDRTELDRLAAQRNAKHVVWGFKFRLALLAELAAWAALGAWLGGTALQVAAGALGGAVLLRLAVVGASFGLAWLWGSQREPQERIGAGAAVALVAGEWRAMLANNFAWLPFENAVLRRDPPPGPQERLPVILVHGYFSNRGTLCGLARALERAGAGPASCPACPRLSLRSRPSPATSSASCAK